MDLEKLAKIQYQDHADQLWDSIVCNENYISLASNKQKTTLKIHNLSTNETKQINIKYQKQAAIKQIKLCNHYAVLFFETEFIILSIQKIIKKTKFGNCAIQSKLIQIQKPFQYLPEVLIDVCDNQDYLVLAFIAQNDLGIITMKKDPSNSSLNQISQTRIDIHKQLFSERRLGLTLYYDQQLRKNKVYCIVLSKSTETIIIQTSCQHWQRKQVFKNQIILFGKHEKEGCFSISYTQLNGQKTLVNIYNNYLMIYQKQQKWDLLAIVDSKEKIISSLSLPTLQDLYVIIQSKQKDQYKIVYYNIEQALDCLNTDSKQIQNKIEEKQVKKREQERTTIQQRRQDEVILQRISDKKSAVLFQLSLCRQMLLKHFRWFYKSLQQQNRELFKIKLDLEYRGDANYQLQFKKIQKRRNRIKYSGNQYGKLSQIVKFYFYSIVNISQRYDYPTYFRQLKQMIGLKQKIGLSHLVQQSPVKQQINFLKSQELQISRIQRANSELFLSKYIPEWVEYNSKQSIAQQLVTIRMEIQKINEQIQIENIKKSKQRHPIDYQQRKGQRKKSFHLQSIKTKESQRAYFPSITDSEEIFMNSGFDQLLLKAIDQISAKPDFLQKQLLDIKKQIQTYKKQQQQRQQ